MLIPSIDLMGGKIVQLVQGDRKALEFDNVEEWAAKFSSFPLIQLIDLDAAMGREPNADLIQFFVKRLPCQVGGGIRSKDSAHKMLNAGAQRVIFGSTLIQNGEINETFAKQLASSFDSEQLVFAIDARGGKVAIRGWKEVTSISPLQMVRALDAFCCAFLYTHIDTEGLMAGLPPDPVRELRAATTRQLIAAGGITTYEEIDRLHQIGVDAVVGMALYSGRMKMPDSISVSK